MVQDFFKVVTLKILGLNLNKRPIGLGSLVVRFAMNNIK